MPDALPGAAMLPCVYVPPVPDPLYTRPCAHDAIVVVPPARIVAPFAIATAFGTLFSCTLLR